MNGSSSPTIFFFVKHNIGTRQKKRTKNVVFKANFVFAIFFPLCFGLCRCLLACCFFSISSLAHTLIYSHITCIKLHITSTSCGDGSRSLFLFALFFAAMFNIYKPTFFLSTSIRFDKLNK